MTVTINNTTNTVTIARQGTQGPPGGGGGGSWGSITGTLSAQTDLQSALDGKATSAQGAKADSALQPNAPITGATKTKITYDADGLVTAGADATTADIADSTNRRYVTDAQLVVIGNTSGTNTGDQTSVTGNAGTATALQTARTINGVSFDGTANIAIGGDAIAEPVNVLTPSSGVVNIDCSLGDYFTLAPTANVTSITFSNLPASGKAQTIMIRFTQDSTPRTVAWPASFKWAGGSAGAVSTDSGAIDVLAITTFDQGTNWIATLAKAFA